jgi:hypothetical protein
MTFEELLELDKKENPPQLNSPEGEELKNSPLLQERDGVRIKKK